LTVYAAGEKEGHLGKRGEGKSYVFESKWGRKWTRTGLQPRRTQIVSGRNIREGLDISLLAIPKKENQCKKDGRMRKLNKTDGSYLKKKYEKFLRKYYFFVVG